MDEATANHDQPEDRFALALRQADLVRERIGRWQQAHGLSAEDSAETLRTLRSARDDELAGLR